MRNNNHRTSVAAALVLACFCVDPANAVEFAIVHAGQLLAVPGEEVLDEHSIVISDGRISDVLPGYVSGSDVGAGAADTVTIHNLRDMFVMPGLIDGHVHLTGEFGPRYRLDAVELSNPDLAIQGAHFARLTLMAGFTTVRDLGAWGGDAIFALRDGIARGFVVGPRVFAAGTALSVTGGHGDESHGFRDDIASTMLHTGICDGVSECRRAVREQVRSTADQIKLTVTAGVMSNTLSGLEQQFFEDELQTIVDTAHLMGLRVAAHAHGVNGINAALRAGVDSIEHGTYLDEESIRLFRQSGAYLVPTMLPGDEAQQWAADPNSNLTPPQREKSLTVGPLIVGMVERAHRAGVPIAFGTDAAVVPHGENGREFALMVSAGMSPMEAIHAATVNGADNLGQSDNLGTIEVGKYGDLIAVDGDPLVDVAELEDVDFVMKEGRVYKHPATLSAR